jgi:hypothetical protein
MESFYIQGLLAFMTQYKIISFAPPKGQVAGSNPARDTNEINQL